MNALVIDCTTAVLYLGVQKGTQRARLALDIGTRQSEKLLPATDYLLRQVELEPAGLDCIGVCTGPGSFTGLRLGTAAAKALSLAHGLPVYGLSALDAYAEPFRSISGTVISVLDAKKGRFYGRIFRGQYASDIFDKGAEDIAALVQETDGSVLAVGPDAALFCREALPFLPRLCCPRLPADTTDALLLLLERKHSGKAVPMQDYDGPLYIRRSEAEEKQGQSGS